MASREDLEKLTDDLAEIFGRELAESLVRAGASNGEFDLDQQLLINDGIEAMTPEQRKHALALIDTLLHHYGKAH